MTTPAPAGGVSPKDKTTALILAILLPGADRIYLGYTGLGILKLVSCGGFLIWAIIDIIAIVQDKLPDSDGLPLKK